MVYQIEYVHVATTGYGRCVTQCDTLSQVPPSKEETAGVVPRRAFPGTSSCKQNKNKKEKGKEKKGLTMYCVCGINMMMGVCAKICN